MPFTEFRKKPPALREAPKRPIYLPDPNPIFLPGSPRDSPNNRLWNAVRLGGTLKEVKKAISEGADVHAKDGHGMTILHYAVNFDRSIVEHLLEQGADINHTDNHGMTALHSAATNFKEGKPNRDMYKYLIQKGANQKLKDDIGRTAEHMATLTNEPLPPYDPSAKFRAKKV